MKIINHLLNQLEDIENSPNPYCHNGCIYGDMCEKKQCYILMEMRGEKLPDIAQKVIDEVENESNNYYQQMRDKWASLVVRFGIPLWQGKAWHEKNCEKICPFGEDCDKKRVRRNGQLLCYGQIYIGQPIKFTNSEIKKLIKKVANCFYCGDERYDGSIICGDLLSCFEENQS